MSRLDDELDNMNDDALDEFVESDDDNEAVEELKKATQTLNEIADDDKTPWYKTPLGIVGLALGSLVAIGGVGVMLTPPNKPATSRSTNAKITAQKTQHTSSAKQNVAHNTAQATQANNDAAAKTNSVASVAAATTQQTASTNSANNAKSEATRNDTAHTHKGSDAVDKALAYTPKKNADTQRGDTATCSSDDDKRRLQRLQAINKSLSDEIARLRQQQRDMRNALANAQTTITQLKRKMALAGKKALPGFQLIDFAANGSVAVVKTSKGIIALARNEGFYTPFGKLTVTDITQDAVLAGDYYIDRTWREPVVAKSTTKTKITSAKRVAHNKPNTHGHTKSKGVRLPITDWKIVAQASDASYVIAKRIDGEIRKITPDTELPGYGRALHILHDGTVLFPGHFLTPKTQ